MKRYALIALLAAPAAFADATVAKPEKAIVCAACHGEAGVSASGMYPNLAGQYANYIEHSLHAYKNGDRKNAIMSAQAANLTDAEIKQLALWFSQQNGPMFTLQRPHSTAAAQ